MSDHYTIMNGEFVFAAEASLRATDLAIQRGYGLFDFFRTVNGRPVFWDDHFDRLFRGAAELRLPLPFDRGQLRELLQELVRRNALPMDSGLRITVTGGYSPDAYTIATPNVLITQAPMKMADPKVGLRLITHQHTRQLPHVKSIDYLMAIWLQQRIRECNADDILYHSSDGIVTECPRSNFGIVTREGVIATPVRNILIGVTRKHVLAAARTIARVEERDVKLEELRGAREAFVLSTSKRVVAVVEINGSRVGDGAAGPIAGKLLAALDERIEREIA